VALSIVVGSNKVAYPNSTSYQESATTYFAQQEGELSPFCYVKPENSEDVSNVVKTLALLNIEDIVCPFAVRGGGHHTVVGIANIHSGITIDLGNINQTTVSQDKTIAHVGSGARWGSVYSTLVPMGLAVLGGRVADIGVGGFTTGGKISWLWN
jgi:FAD/FMN-containing dehydrogenase